jgi:putative membrane protein
MDTLRIARTDGPRIGGGMIEAGQGDLSTTTAIGMGLLVASNSFAQTSHPNLPPASAVTTISKLDQQDRNFINEAAAGGMAEVAFSKMAEKSDNPDVKRFAEKMVRDHKAANKKLTTIANEAGVEIPKTG